MKIRPEIQQKVEETLESLNGIQRAEPQPFFYTRLIGRLQREERGIWETIGSFLSRPVVATVSLCLILILNVFILTRPESTQSASSSLVTSDLTSPDSEYILANSNSFDYENLDQ